MDYCKQCSLYKYDQDFKDLANLAPEYQLIDTENPMFECYSAFCEGCGEVIVDIDGQRVDPQNWRPPVE
jgi:hypothetical protein